MNLVVRLKGGKGSGHHGHAGRPGKHGGSLPSGVAVSIRTGRAAAVRAGWKPDGKKKPEGGAPLGGQVTTTPLSGMREGAVRNANEVIEEIVRTTDMTSAEIKAKIAERLDEDLAQPIAIRRGLRGALNISEEGRFKTQFETGTSGGYFDPIFREIAEENGLGVSSKVPHNVRPIYGYFSAGNPDITDYGAVEFILKDSVRTRTTYTIGDSLEGFSGQYQIGGKRSADVAAWDDNIHSYMENGVRASLTYKGPPYVEAQIHGGLSLKDVAKVVIHTGGRHGPGRYDPVRDALKLKGVTVEYVDTE